MTSTLMSALVGLIESSIEIWDAGRDVAVDSNDEGGILISTPQQMITIDRAPPGMPFRWVVKTDGRTRTAASIPGVLRIVRQHLSTTYQRSG